MTLDTDFSLHGQRFPVSLEKWYIDVLLPDSGVVLIYVGVLTLAGRRFSRVTAELFRSGHDPKRGSAAVKQLEGGPGSLRCSALSIEGEQLRFSTAGLSGDLRFAPRCAPWRPAAPFYRSGRRTLTWSVEVPDSDVAGEITWPGGGCQIAGRGYRDRVRFDVLPWKLPFDRLVWGRAVTGSHAAIWNRAVTRDGALSEAWLDGQARPFDTAAGTPNTIKLGQSRVLIDSDVADLEGLRLGTLRKPFGRLSRAPHETKWQAPATIAGEPGVAIHEIVSWH